MFSSATTSLLEESLSALPAIVAEKSLRHDIDELVASVLPPSKLAVIDDVFTSTALGDRVFKGLKGRFASTHVTLSKHPQADEQTAQYLRMQTLSSDALVAVGSGVISDLCKYVAMQDGKPYIVFPTAASMNGYLSANASITVDDYKKTVPAKMPKAVFCDLSVIADAPVRLSKSGLGDCLARPTAQADWLLSHLLLDTAYDEKPFALLAPYEAQLFDQARGVAMQDAGSIEILVKMLLLSGLGMTIAGGSYPASQAEHMIAHAYGMTHGAHETLHGEEIGVTTLTMAKMQEELLRSRLTLQGGFDENRIVTLYGRKVAREAKKSFAQKEALITQAKVEARLAEKATWEKVAEKIEKIHLSPARVQAILKEAKAPDKPEALGWLDVDYQAAVESARYLRERFTFLDLVRA